jgi:hypothetical protein
MERSRRLVVGTKLGRNLMTTPTRRWLLPLTMPILVLVMAAQLLVSTPPATADPVIPINWTVNASTHLAKLDLDVTVPPGTFVGSIDLADGNLTGSLTLPPATTRFKAAGLPLADATFAISQANVVGHVDFATLQVTATSTFDIRVVSVRPVLLPFVNLVGNRCTTSTPISVTMSGQVDLAAGSTFTGVYTIPPLENCGLATPALNLLVPGSGNTFTASFSPTAP